MKAIRGHIANKNSIIHITAVTIDRVLVVITSVGDLKSMSHETEIKTAATTKNADCSHMTFRRSD